MIKPDVTVGRIVHFYDRSLAAMPPTAVIERDGKRIYLNGQGAGPYAAIVVQAMPGYANLRVMAYGGDWIAGSVAFKGEGDGGQWWEWPPRD